MGHFRAFIWCMPYMHIRYCGNSHFLAKIILWPLYSYQRVSEWRGVCTIKFYYDDWTYCELLKTVGCLEGSATTISGEGGGASGGNSWYCTYTISLAVQHLDIGLGYYSAKAHHGNKPNCKYILYCAPSAGNSSQCYIYRNTGYMRVLSSQY